MKFLFSFKVVSFTSGIGNQLFQYSFCKYLETKSNALSIYGYYNRSWLSNHNGLVIQDFFDVDLPKRTLYTDSLVVLIRILRKVFPGTTIASSDQSFRNGACFFDGYWQNKRYLTDDIVSMIRFKRLILSKKNEKILNEISQTNSVSIHVRRGDYLHPSVVNKYGGVCTLEYYRKAINLISNYYSDVNFYVFSDDIAWVEKNLRVFNATYVNWNTGRESAIDMYLMSHCKANIIANSTFSYWAAMLNNSRDKIVIYPRAWFSYPHDSPDIFEDDWIGI